MKRIFLFSLCLVCLTAGAVNLQFNLGNFSSENLVGRRVLVTPITLTNTPGSVPSMDAKFYTTTNTGYFWISNMVSGTYSFEIQAPPSVTKYRLFIPPGTTNCTADSRLITTTNSTDANTFAYTIAAVDALVADVAQTNIAVSAVTNAGTMIYTNGAAFISAATNIATQVAKDATNALGSAAYSASGAFDAAGAAQNATNGTVLRAANVTTQVTNYFGGIATNAAAAATNGMALNRFNTNADGVSVNGNVLTNLNNQFTNRNSLSGAGNIRIGTNVTDLSLATNCVLIGDFSNFSQYVVGTRAIYIGGADGGSAFGTCIAIGSGAGAGVNRDGDKAISIGDQADAFGVGTINIGGGNSIASDGSINIGTTTAWEQSNHASDCIVIGNGGVAPTKNHQMLIGNGDGSGGFTTTETIIAGKMSNSFSGVLNAVIVNNRPDATTLSNDLTVASGDLAITKGQAFFDGGSISTSKDASGTVTADVFVGVTGSGAFVGEGDALLDLNASELSFGTVPPARLAHVFYPSNFVTGVTYSNRFGVQIEVSANIALNAASGIGLTSVALEVPGYITNTYSVSTIVGTLAMVYSSPLASTVPANALFCFTNKSTVGTSTVGQGKLSY